MKHTIQILFFTSLLVLSAVTYMDIGSRYELVESQESVFDRDVKALEASRSIASQE